MGLELGQRFPRDSGGRTTVYPPTTNHGHDARAQAGKHRHVVQRLPAREPPKLFYDLLRKVHLLILYPKLRIIAVKILF